MPPRPVFLALLAAAVLAAGARSADEPALTIALPEDRVRLGEDVVVQATFTNRTREAVIVPGLRLARDSVSLTVDAPGAGLEGAVLTRLYGSFDRAEGGLEFRSRATPRRRLAPGEAMTERLRFPALLLGPLTVRAAFGAPGPRRWRSTEARVEVVPAGTAREPVAVLDTTRGAVLLRMRPVPHYAAAAQFWSLARAGFYDGLDVHRVVPGRIVQSGDPRGDGSGDAGWFVPSARVTARLRAGEVGLARGAHRDSASSQWFVALTDGTSGEYAVFAEVAAGLDVVRTLRAGDSADTIRAVRVEVR